jgi:hypothetical protein
MPLTMFLFFTDCNKANVMIQSSKRTKLNMRLMTFTAEAQKAAKESVFYFAFFEPFRLTINLTPHKKASMMGGLST